MKYSLDDGFDTITTDTKEVAEEVFESIKELYKDEFDECIDFKYPTIEILGSTFFPSDVLMENDPDKWYEEFEKWFPNAFRYTVDDVRHEVELMDVGETLDKFCGEKIEFSVTRLE